MALRLLIADQAKQDTGRILGHIACENPEAATRLADALEKGILRLLEFPMSAPMVPNRIDPTIRQLIIPPLRILYRIADGDLFIVGIMRCEQNLSEDTIGGL